MIGNAVSPPLARALGICLSLAAAGRSPLGEHLVSAEDSLWVQAHQAAESLGLKSLYEVRNFISLACPRLVVQMGFSSSQELQDQDLANNGPKKARHNTRRARS